MRRYTVFWLKSTSIRLFETQGSYSKNISGRCRFFAFWIFPLQLSNSAIRIPVVINFFLFDGSDFSDFFANFFFVDSHRDSNL